MVLEKVIYGKVIPNIEIDQKQSIPMMKLRCNDYFYVPTDSFWSLAPDCLYVFCAEFLVDWVKHAFITRFNPELSTDLYKVYTTNLAYDLAITKQTNVSSIYDL